MTPSHCKIKCVGCFLWFFCQPSSNESRHSPSWRGRSCLCSGIGPRHPVLPAAHSLTYLGQKSAHSLTSKVNLHEYFLLPVLGCFGLLSVCGSCAPCSYMSRVVDLLWKQLEPGAPTLLSAVLGRMTKGGTEALSPPLLPINFSFVILVFCISFDQSEIGELRRKGLPTFIQSVILNFGLFVPPFEGEGQTFVFSPKIFCGHHECIF